MTRTISLITATVGAALLFAVPAWGDNWGADQSNQPVSVSPDIVDVLTAKNGTVDSSVSDALNQPSMLDAWERALVARSDGLNRLYGLGEYAAPVVADFDRFYIDGSNEPVTVSATSSSRDIEWPTVGVGLGIALALMLGLVLTLKATHSRPFAH